MKKTFFYATTLAVLTTIGGCELKSEDYSNISSDLYPTTERDARDMVTACYAVLGNNQYGGAFNSATGFNLLADAATDQFQCGWGGANWYPLVEGDFANNEGERNPRRKWSEGNNLSRMELTIDRLRGISMDETKKKQYIAEVEAAQGFLAFLLWDFYGGLVIADIETLRKPQDEVILPRKTYDETYAYIQTKLTNAARVLPPTIAYGSSNYGRFTAGLCHMLLLKLYMQKREWALAETEGRELMKPEYGYGLVTERGGAASAYANIFTDANEGNKETIWAVNELRDFSSTNWGAHTSDWWGDGYRMMRSFFNSFEDGDTRNAIGQLIQDDGRDMGIQPLKYEMSNADNMEDVYQDWIVFRYADAITLLAEAIVKKGNAVTQEAVNLLNSVRTRAGLTAYSMGDFDAAMTPINGVPNVNVSSVAAVNNFVDKLLWERAHELWFEGARRQDLIRNDIYRATMQAKRDARAVQGNVTPDTESDYHLMPLPTSAINEFKKGGFSGQQNPGYGE